jgi:hypothetical protein
MNKDAISITDEIIELPDQLDYASINNVWYAEDNQMLISNGTDWNFTHTVPQVLFENSMPNITDVSEMCKEYPALEKAYENFKTIYKMVEQDWNGKQKEQNSPPF